MDLVLAITKNTNEHILSFYWNGSSFDAEWTLRDSDKNVLKVEPVSFMQKLALDLNVKEDSQGRMEVSFGMPIADSRQLYLVSTPERQSKFSLIFNDTSRGLCVLEEIFVNFGTDGAKCLCKCVELNGTQFVDIVPIDIGPFANFL